MGGGDTDGDGALSAKEMLQIGAEWAAARRQGDWMSATQRVSSPPPMSGSPRQQSPGTTTLPHQGPDLAEEVRKAEEAAQELTAEYQEASRRHRLGRDRYKLMQKQQPLLATLTEIVKAIEARSATKHQALHRRARIALARVKELFE